MTSAAVFLVPLAGVLGLVFALIFASQVRREDAGTDRMKEISSAIHEGASAFLAAEYKVLVIFIAVLFLVIGFALQNWIEAVCFAVGALFSILAGFFGMQVATLANVRTANGARTSGMAKALWIAYHGGAVMGFCVVGLGVFGASIIYFLTGNADVLFGYSLGASSVALFARVGGGIYTKAADVGADLVGKVENNIPEDDPRNPAVIADNVGDNVGDVAGMGADLFESYVGALISAVTLGLASSYAANGALFPLFLASIGIVASIIGTFFVKGEDGGDPVIIRDEYRTSGGQLRLYEISGVPAPRIHLIAVPCDGIHNLRHGSEHADEQKGFCQKAHGLSAEPVAVADDPGDKKNDHKEAGRRLGRLIGVDQPDDGHILAKGGQGDQDRAPKPGRLPPHSRKDVGEDGQRRHKEKESPPPHPVGGLTHKRDAPYGIKDARYAALDVFKAKI